MTKPARTRFAPSPTGYMHVGGVRTALFAWLTARQTGGQFILRIEDTDKNREVAGSIQHIIDSLHWLGLQWDEGPDLPGKYGPYVQSSRKTIYEHWAKRLVESNRAYADTRTPEEIDALREDAKQKEQPFLARNYRPENPPAWSVGMPLRFKAEPKAYNWHDAVMGDMHAGPEAVDDFILMKSDGLPTYNFAHIVDDAEMQITHIMRGQEFVAGVPNYLNLYEALQLEVPILAHLPQIMRPDGRKKLGKRDGAKDLLEYSRDGYLPAAMLNFLASLGWNDGTEQEIFSVDELVEKFSLRRVQRSGAKFDEQRLQWMNGMHIRALPLDELFVRAEGFWPAEAAAYDETYKKQVLSLIQERLKFLAEIPELTRFFFTDLPVNLDLVRNDKQLGAMKATELTSLLESTHRELAESDFSVEDLTRRLNSLLETTQTKPRILFSLIRIASTQAPASPGLADTLAVLGKDTSLRRLGQTIAALKA